MQEEEKMRQEKSVEASKISRAEDDALFLINNIMKFCFSIVTLIAVALSLISSDKREEDIRKNYSGIIISFIILIGIYLLNLFMNSESEYGLALEYTWKTGLISIILSVAFLFLWTKLQGIKDNLDKMQRIIILISSFLLTSGIAFFLTCNIDIEHFSTPWNEGKSPFVAYPWNLLSFIILNGFLWYSLILKNNRHSID